MTSNSEDRNTDILPAHRPGGFNGRVHIQGIGNIGKLLAHSLATVSDRPPIVLMLHRSGLIQAWETAGHAIDLITDGISNKQEGYEVEVIRGSSEEDRPLAPRRSRSDSAGDVIHNLIIATKTIHTVSALSAIKSRLTQDSTILFTQNGMGTIDEVNAKLFQDVTTRPKYLTAIISHGVYSQGLFSSVHAGFGTTTIGLVPQTPHTDAGGPRNEDVGKGSPLSSSYLPNLITQASVLAATVVSPVELMQIQFEKLIINAMMNPLTVVFDCRNGELFKQANTLRIMQLLLSEASHVIRSLPELQHVQGVGSRFSRERLEGVVLRVAEKTARNFSSMLQDARAGRETEIDYINGYIVKRGEQLGVDCAHNRTLVQMVKEKRRVTDADVDNLFP